MKESIGGTMLFWIVLFFMSIFIAFLAAVIQYAKVYKIKNSVINYLEQGEGISSQTEFEDILTRLGYSKKNGYVVCRYNAQDRGGYYFVKLYANFEVMSFSLKVKIKGETRLIETGVLVKSEDWFKDFDQDTNCFGSGVNETELTRVG